MATSPRSRSTAASADRRVPRARRSAPIAGRAFRWVVLLAVAVAIVVPIGFAFLGGFRTTGAIRNDPAGLPGSLELRPLRGGAHRRRCTGSSSSTASSSRRITVVVVVTVSALAAFVFARFEFPGREALFTLFALGLLFPAAVAILPLYILLRTIGLLDNPLGVALPLAAFGIPLTIIILRPFFKSIPVELEDAAAIDGCSRFGFFWRILLPLSRPALATVAILALVGSWNAFLLPLLILGGQRAVDAAARGLQLLHAVLAGRGRRPRLRLAVDGPGAPLLRVRGAPAHRRA